MSKGRLISERIAELRKDPYKAKLLDRAKVRIYHHLLQGHYLGEYTLPQETVNKYEMWLWSYKEK